MNPCNDSITELYNRNPSKNQALRTTFEYRKGELNLVSIERQNMLAPPPQALFTDQTRVGAWIELRDQHNVPVYRRVINDPFLGLEVVGEHSSDTLHRIKNAELTSAFFFILPDIPNARHLLFCSTNSEVTVQQQFNRHNEQVIFEFDLSVIDEDGDHGRE